jgi:ADP-ribosylglycohydrolase
LSFCLAEAISQTTFDIQTVAQNFIHWHEKGWWTAHGVIFDHDDINPDSIIRLIKGAPPEASGNFSCMGNRNGSLIRILPLVFQIADSPMEERFRVAEKISTITHGNIEAIIACWYCLEFARLLIKGWSKTDAYRELQIQFPLYLEAHEISVRNRRDFSRLLHDDITTLPEEEITTEGFASGTLEASIWCLLTTESFRDATLKAVNLGYDADATGAITGGLGGLLYGVDGIPKDWLEVLVRRQDIEELAERLAKRLNA